MTSIAIQTKDDLAMRINNAILHHDLYLRLDHYFWKRDEELLKETLNNATVLSDNNAPRSG